MRIEIRHGRVIDPESRFDRATSVYVADGRIAAIREPPDGWSADRVLDARGAIVCPGLVDLAARLREPGLEHKATLESEMDAAVAGGVTRLACPPDTDPPLDEPGLVQMLKHRARTLGRAHVHPIGALTVRLEGQHLTEMGELAEAGCVAFSQADRPIVDTTVLWRAMEYAATFGHRVWMRPEDPYLGRSGVAHEGVVSTRLGLAAIPSAAETIAVATLLAIVRETGVRMHLCRLSTGGAVAQVREAKASGLPITCEVAIHHLHLCDVDIGWFDAQAHLVPPLRSVRDRDALRAGVADGTIDAICSDHAPVDDDGKQLPFAESEPGATALELLLPLTLKWAAETEASLVDALARITSRPADVIGIDAGRLAAGHVADLCIFDPAAPWIVSRSALASQGKNTPFLGLELQGRVRWTLVDGQVVYESHA